MTGYKKNISTWLFNKLQVSEIELYWFKQQNYWITYYDGFLISLKFYKSENQTNEDNRLNIVLTIFYDSYSDNYTIQYDVKDQVAMYTKLIAKVFEPLMQLLNRKSAWYIDGLQEKASEKQLNFIKNLGIKQLPKNKSNASEIITCALAKKKFKELMDKKVVKRVVKKNLDEYTDFKQMNKLQFDNVHFSAKYRDDGNDTIN
jgi:hypothetical protein